ncbi:cell wall protein PRY3-like isoform X2 [Leguminivora glycinivorella]|nr:cell wall protein PRY3-like isoform X2 [Leguminivora glycinivorella]
MNNQHTLCKFQTPGPAAHCLDYELTIKSDNDKQLILDKINARRDKVASGDIRSLPAAEDMFKMEWNEELAQSAQRWADQCVSNKDVGEIEDDCRDLESTRVGQNIGTVYGEAPGLTPSGLVDVWYLQLLNVNASVISRYRPSNESGPASYNQFTQLVWAASYQVGCGGVKFKEYIQDSEEKKDRVVYRLVCNFAPSGNQLNQPVYTAGQPGKCTYGTSETYKALCNSQPISLHGIGNTDFDDSESEDAETTTDIISVDEAIINNQTTNLTTDDPNLYDDNMTFDYFSHLFELTKEHFSTSTTPGITRCKNELAVDEIVKIVKNKLSDDPALKAILATTVSTSSGNIVKDEKVAEFLNKIYIKATSTSKPETFSTDYVNSTLLVNLVEAVMFRHTDGVNDQVTQEILGPFVNPIKIQAVSAVRPNYDFTGHYFFPEYYGEETTKISSEADYDINYKPSEQDVVMEIEEIRKSRPTRDFIDEILETESIVETTTRMKPLSPDDMKATN